jgi:hypothetical protein
MHTLIVAGEDLHSIFALMALTSVVVYSRKGRDGNTMSEQLNGASPVIVFYSYAHEDESLRNELEKHLSLLQRQGLIATWHDRKIVPGTDWAHAINSHLNEAAIILLLISPDFMASDYCYGNEMQFALHRNKRGLAQAIPIVPGHTSWPKE